MINIALIDDHQIFLEGLTSMLSAEKDFNILFSENSARGALIKLKEVKPHLIISDISMPDMNGIEFAKIVREKYPEIKILILSMFKEIQSIENIEGYLLKYTDREELIKVIKNIVINNEVHHELIKKENSLVFNKSILTDREKEIIKHIINEDTSEEIAEKLFISKQTVITHRKNIILKLQVKNLAGLVKKAIYLGIIE